MPLLLLFFLVDLAHLDEMFEAVTLIQTQKSEPFPVVLIGKTYWQGLVTWMREVMLARGCIDED
jgi:predicted Rossmann-fold nucleotide-binding protein